MTRRLCTVVLLLLVVACEQLTVHGPVGSATITVSALQSGEVLLSGEMTRSLEELDSSGLTEGDDLALLRQLGQFDLRELPVDAGSWYLVTLDGGVDYDSDENGEVDNAAGVVLGPVRGLVTGAQIKSGGHMFGVLSEAAWQWVREHYAVLTPDELQAALDEFAASLVGDVLTLGSPGVNYADLLAWNPLYFGDSYYLGPPEALDELQGAIAEGADDATRLAIVLEMTPLSVPVGASDAWFREDVSPNVAQGICGVCHLESGIAGQGPHSLVPTSNPDHLEVNDAMYRVLVESLGAEGILTYAVGGNGHQGLQQLFPGTTEYAAFETYLTLLEGSNSGGTDPQSLLQGFSLATPGETLRRASLLLAGSLPSEEDIAAVSAGDEETLRFMIRFLMQGEGFHRFLLEGANDRLLTDKWIDNLLVEIFFAPYYPDLVNRLAELGDSGQTNEAYRLIQGASFGLARQPLELIAYVVEQEMPYTEILTADYTMVNPQLALAYGSAVSFDDDENIDQWQVGSVESYIRIDDSLVYQPADTTGAYVSGGLPTDYPQAGLLNTPGWLARYPSTDTNRNRARSRWTWYHFLGFDIEGSAPRTTDPEALADTDNPTLKNPNCTVCHEVMDPVAGAYQNYGDTGFYKNQPGGIDSLPRTYKRDRGLEEPYVFGETWYNDMRDPGFETAVYANQQSTLQNLALDMVADSRFATATVKFWWPALMGEEVATPPAEETDLDYAERLALFQAQSESIESLASGFAAGFDGGAPYNLKDLLVELVMSDWFRLDAADETASASAGLESVGTGKLLTPEQLDRKTEAVTGFRWYESEERGVTSSRLTDDFRLFYGGIDSDGVTRRATEMTSLMTTVVEAQPLQMACVLVGFEFQWPITARQIFTEIEKQQHEANDEPALRRQLVAMHERFLGETLTADDPEIDRALALFTETRAARVENGYPPRLNGSDEESCPFFFIDTTGWDLDDPDHTLNTWISMLIYYMTDYRYVYE